MDNYFFKLKQKFNFYKENGYFDKLIVNRYHYTGDDIDFFASNTRNLTFEVTEKCNLSCTYCIYGKYYNNNKIGSKKDLDFSVAKNIIDYFICNWTSNKNSSHKKGITIGFYGGEALLNFDLISQIVSYVKSTEIFKENHIGFTMTTNGVLLGKHISFLVENNFDLLISLDGGTEHNNSYRTFHNNKSAFDIIYNNIIDLKNKYPDYFLNKVNFLSILHDRNSYHELMNFFNSEFGKIAGIAELATDNINPEFKEQFLRMYRQTPSVETKSDNISKTQISNSIKVDFQGLFKFIGTYSGYTKDTYYDLITNNENKTRIPTATCKPFSRMIFVTVDGKILPCERISSNYTLGYFENNSLKIDFNTVAKIFNDYLDSLYENLCGKCVREFWCNTCLFHTNVGTSQLNCNEFIECTQDKIENFFSRYISEFERNPSLYHQVANFKTI